MTFKTSYVSCKNKQYADSINVFQIYTNGYVTFDSEYNSGRPQKFTGQRAGQPDAMVAPLWSDMDMTGDSNIWYHFYNRFSANSSVLLEAQSLIVDNYKDPVLASSFSPNTALVVTWENVKPAPASIYSSEVLCNAADNTSSFVTKSVL